jgi:hypothetical protein
MLLSACGSGARQDASEPSGHYSVEVPAATFPASQTLSQHTQMVIAVRNAGSKTIPDVAITITDAKYGTTAQAFGQRVDTPTTVTNSGLASASRAVWVVDQGPAARGCGYSCASGGAGGGVTAYSNTWALGRLAPGQTATFKWNVTAVTTGTHVINYVVAAGLNGKAIAQLANGQRPTGSFTVTIHNAPQQAYVNNQGQVVTTP